MSNEKRQVTASSIDVVMIPIFLALPLNHARKKSMSKFATCASIGSYADALTRGKQYEVLDEDHTRQQVKILGDNGRVRWYPSACFDLDGTPTPLMTYWQYDAAVGDPLDDWIEVSFDLSDGTRRWLSFVTPLRLKRLLEAPASEMSIWSDHMVIVRSLEPERIDQVLKMLDQDGDLIKASVPYLINQDDEAISNDDV
jgi:hypothetical protein